MDVEGYQVLVGRGSDENDDLTFNVAEPDDIWLHVGGGTPGSHVVIRNPSRGDIPNTVIEAAAAFAAWYSKSRGAPRVEVNYCRAGNVSKPRGAPAGLVQIERFKSVKVTPKAPSDGGTSDGGAA